MRNHRLNRLWTAKIITALEDVLEELTGDIADEYDEADTAVVARPDDSFLVDGLLSYADAVERIGLPSRYTSQCVFPGHDGRAGTGSN